MSRYIAEQETERDDWVLVKATLFGIALSTVLCLAGWLAWNLIRMIDAIKVLGLIKG